jgi:hypothetical protein
MSKTRERVFRELQVITFAEMFNFFRAELLRNPVQVMPVLVTASKAEEVLGRRVVFHSGGLPLLTATFALNAWPPLLALVAR